MKEWDKILYGSEIPKNSNFKVKSFIVISSVSTAIISLFYLYAVSSFLHIPIFPFVNRITFSTNFNSFVISENIDHAIIIGLFLLWMIISIKNAKVKLIACSSVLILISLSQITNHQWIIDAIIMSSLPVILSLLFYNNFVTKIFLNDYSKLTGKFIVFLGLVLGIWSLIVVLIPIFGQSINQEIFHNHVYQIFMLFGNLIPFFMFILMFSYPVKIFTDNIVQRLGIKSSDSTFNSHLRTRWKIIFLTLCILLSVFLSIIPHLDSINADKQIIGVDTHYYVEWLTALIESSDSDEFIQQAFIEQKQGDRPFSLIVFFTISQLSKTDLEQTVEYLPLILAPALVLVMYFFTRELTGNDTVSILSSVLTAVSFQTLGGIYSGLYANWFALIIGFLSLIFMFKFLKNAGKVNLLIFSTLFLSVLFSHVYTWIFMTAVLVTFLLVMYGLKSYQRKNVLILIVIVFSVVLVDVTKTISSDSIGGIEKGIIFLNDEKKFSSEEFLSSYPNLVFSTTTISGGQISNFIFFALSLYWLFVCDKRKSYNIFILILFSIGFIPMIFSNPMIQTRLIYDISIQIPAAIALTEIWKRSNTKLILPVICIWLISFAIRSESNFILKIP